MTPADALVLVAWVVSMAVVGCLAYGFCRLAEAVTFELGVWWSIRWGQFLALPEVWGSLEIPDEYRRAPRRHDGAAAGVQDATVGRP